MSAGIDVVVAVAEGRDPLAGCRQALEREAGDWLRVVRATSARLLGQVVTRS